MATAVRPIACSLSNLSRPDGSAIYCQGDSSAQAAVYGPAEVRVQKEIVDEAYVEVIYKPKIGVSGCAEKFDEEQMKATLQSVILKTLHPRTSVTIIIQELEDRGNLTACAINSACLALMDSGIEMNHMVAGVCTSIINDEVIVHPTDKQEAEADMNILWVFDSHLEGSTSSIVCHGMMSVDQFKASYAEALKAADSIFKFYRESIEKRHCKDSDD